MNLIWWGGMKDVEAERIWPNLKNQNKANSLREGKWIIRSHLFKVGVCVCVTQTLDNLNVEKEPHVFLLQVDRQALSRHGNAHTSNDGQAGVGSSTSLQCEPCVPWHPPLEYQRREFLRWVTHFWDKPLLLLLLITQAYRECCCYPLVRRFALQWDW